MSRIYSERSLDRIADYEQEEVLLAIRKSEVIEFDTGEGIALGDFKKHVAAIAVQDERLFAASGFTVFQVDERKNACVIEAQAIGGINSMVAHEGKLYCSNQMGDIECVGEGYIVTRDGGVNGLLSTEQHGLLDFGRAGVYETLTGKPLHRVDTSNPWAEFTALTEWGDELVAAYATGICESSAGGQEWPRSQNVYSLFAHNGSVLRSTMDDFRYVVQALRPDGSIEELRRTDECIKGFTYASRELVDRLRGSP